jgi:hypothetical protein
VLDGQYKVDITGLETARQKTREHQGITSIPDSLHCEQQQPSEANTQYPEPRNFKRYHPISISPHATARAMPSQLLGLPREVRDSRPHLPRQCSCPPLETDTDFSSVISEIIMVNDQPFHFHNPIYGRGHARTVVPRSTKTPPSSFGMLSTCKQFHLEYASLLRKAAFSPGTKTIAPVYDFDFAAFIHYVQTLRPHEIKAANRNGNLVVNLFIFDATLNEEAAENLMAWIRCCEKLNLEFTYVVRWAAIDVRQWKAMEGAIGGTVEGRKILGAIGSRNVKAWSWERYQAGLEKQGRSQCA